MTLHTLTFLIEAFIQCCIIFAVWQCRRDLRTHSNRLTSFVTWVHGAHSNALNVIFDKIDARANKLAKELDSSVGIAQKIQIDSRVATKMADRAFNMASSATLGVVALQKALAVPRLLTKQQGQMNQLAKNEIDELFKVKGAQDWLRPLMSDEELDILDKAEAEAERQRMNPESDA